MVVLDPNQFGGITVGIVLILAIVSAILISQMRRP